MWWRASNLRRFFFEQGERRKEFFDKCLPTRKVLFFLVASFTLHFICVISISFHLFVNSRTKSQKTQQISGKTAQKNSLPFLCPVPPRRKISNKRYRANSASDQFRADRRPIIASRANVSNCADVRELFCCSCVSAICFSSRAVSTSSQRTYEI